MLTQKSALSSFSQDVQDQPLFLSIYIYKTTDYPYSYAAASS